MTRQGSLQRQWLLGVSAITLLTLLLSIMLVLQHARRSVVVETQAGTALVGDLLSAWPVMATTAEARRALNDFSVVVRKTRHLCDLVERGAPESSCALDPGIAAPRWFIEHLNLPSDLGTQSVTVRTAQGPLHMTVIADTRHEIEEAWRESRGVMSFIAAFALAVVLLAGQSFRRASVVLHALAADVRRIALGDYRSKTPMRTVPRELLPLVDATAALRRSLEAATSENRQLARQCMEAQERERHEVARELHDEVGQHLTAAEAQLSVAARCSDPARRAQASEQVRDSLRAIFGSVHGLLGRLRPAAIDSVGLLGALEQLACDWRAQGGGVDLTVALYGDDRWLEPRVAIHVYRVAQEALTNIARHATGAHKAVLHCRCGRAGDVELVIGDDGPGLTVEPADGGGFGLPGMRERAASIDATLAVTRSPDWATLIRLTRPPVASDRLPAEPEKTVVTCG